MGYMANGSWLIGRILRERNRTKLRVIQQTAAEGVRLSDLFIYLFVHSFICLGTKAKS